MAGGNGSVSMDAMRAHLEGVFIGYRPGDPTASHPPDAMPAPAVPAPPGLKVLDLRQVTMAELHAEAAATLERDPFEVLLPDPPGVPPDRVAYVTGHEPPEPPEQQQQQHGQQRQRSGSAASKLSDAELVAVLARCLPAGDAAAAAGPSQQQQQEQQQQQQQQAPPPISWAELGLSKGGPRMGGLDCDLQQLWQLAYLKRGGYEAVSAGKQWADVARELGADMKRVSNAGYLTEQWYRRFLLPYERHLQQAIAAAQRQGGKQAVEAAAEGEMEVVDGGLAVPERVVV